VVAALGAVKESQWMVAFALETEDQRMRALQKLERKSCDLVVVNGPKALASSETEVEVIDARGTVVGSFSGSKTEVAQDVFRVIQERLIG
jgi:phosphopantothenoylcysteine decarboxylase/phosphopantothenate--cysteine ligase